MATTAKVGGSSGVLGASATANKVVAATENGKTQVPLISADYDSEVAVAGAIYQDAVYTKVLATADKTVADNLTSGTGTYTYTITADNGVYKHTNGDWYLKTGEKLTVEVTLAVPSGSNVAAVLNSKTDTITIAAGGCTASGTIVFASDMTDAATLTTATGSATLTPNSAATATVISVTAATANT